MGASEAEAPATIIVTDEGEITISDMLSCGETAPLNLIGTGRTIASAANVTLLAVTSGADLHVSGLSFSGPGGFVIGARADTDGLAGKGIFVDLPDDQTGTLTVTLGDFMVTSTAGHGIHNSDGTLADGCGGGIYKMSEADVGDVVGTVLDASATDTGGVGFVFEEEHHGSVDVTGLRITTSGNDDGETGLEAVREDDGDGALRLIDSDIADGVEDEGGLGRDHRGLTCAAPTFLDRALIGP